MGRQNHKQPNLKFLFIRENILGQYFQVHITRGAPNSLIGEEVQGGASAERGRAVS